MLILYQNSLREKRSLKGWTCYWGLTLRPQHLSFGRPFPARLVVFLGKIPPLLLGGELALFGFREAWRTISHKGNHPGS